MLAAVWMWMVVVGELTTGASANRNCSSVPAPCLPHQYCVLDTRTPGVQDVICVACDQACDGCLGPNNDNCKQCKTGYVKTGSLCQACPLGKFGANCTGTCHCLDQTKPCRPADGFCDVWKCDRGWQNPPRCQTPCNNSSFGLDCANTCNCPDDVTCDPVNGLCPNGICHPDYSGPSCQIRLPKLVSPPEVTSVGCRTANVTWKGWDVDVDIGEGPIANYRFYRARNLSQWTLQTTVNHLPSRQVYFFFMSDLDPDMDYRFRVDTYRLDDDKVMAEAAMGFPTDLTFIPCSVTTEPPPSTTTIRSIVGLRVFETVNPELLPNDQIRMSWRISNNVTQLNTVINISAYYQEVGVGDCSTQSGDVKEVPVTQSTPFGNVVISGLTPWRVYAITLEAFAEEFNITDRLERRLSTREIAPTGTVTNIALRDLTSRSVTILWSDVTCALRGGVFVQFNVRRNSSGILLNTVVNVTSIQYNQLTPYTQYEVEVQYENALGQGPYSAPFPFLTSEEAPGAMAIVSVTSTESTFQVTFTQPVPTNGILTEYGITYSEDQNFTVAKTLTLPTSRRVVDVDGLASFTTYYVRMRARTNAAWGPYTAVQVIQTKQDYPEAPTTLAIVSNNETCLIVSWQPPSVTNGNLENYRITYRLTSGGDSATVDAVAQDVTQYRACSLRSGTSYLFAVAARNSHGYSPDVTESFWTEHGDPTAPRPPVFLNATYSSILIEIEPVVLTSGPLSAYQIRVERTGARRKRQGTLPGYLTAVLSQGEVTQRRMFEVGDGKNYGGAVNVMLEREKQYNVYYVVVSTLNSVTKTA